ncbi:uncharacterized protein LOC142349055 [Convolutriloba macropyga]|uniref:uncharacterized protein LOC142349055 n=1 Tax=Convolutriloba macropyga TaxID=536237 RepID=UPI003F51FB47
MRFPRYFSLIVLALSSLEFSSSNQIRESLTFILPFEKDGLGKQCLQYSQWFCLQGFHTTEMKSRQPEEGDLQEFQRKIFYSHQELNWFSFKQNDKANYGCCSLQVDAYQEHGRSRGFSPMEYASKIFDLQFPRKLDLVYLKKIGSEARSLRSTNQKHSVLNLMLWHSASEQESGR